MKDQNLDGNLKCVISPDISVYSSRSLKQMYKDGQFVEERSARYITSLPSLTKPCVQ